MQILLATHNKKKRNQLAAFLEPIGYEVLTAEEAGVNLRDVEETGSTFEENARLKAAAGVEDSGLPCLADDSGLCVEALDGAPGVYSARFAGAHGNDSLNNALLLSKLEGVTDRRAHYACAVCLRYPDGKELLARGACQGKIGYAPRGTKGFGYDPLFIPDAQPDKTFAELEDAEKLKINHRGNALRCLVQLLSEGG
ncbi:MAG: RdgB/HAM1 family non-canonical purine NTP pyrophosphatase [Oscillospiraceae bacterium]|jgi:XTP/dITP diphosphohydrolase|nr:RdgB/HAM1 family non-canonical purine NTP pyrophosphatase [Oscillospiraceae bacterium]